MRELFKDLYSGQKQNKAAANSTCVNKAALVKKIDISKALTFGTVCCSY